MNMQYGISRSRVVRACPAMPREIVAHDAEVVECHVCELRAPGALAHRPNAGRGRLQALETCLRTCMQWAFSLRAPTNHQHGSVGVSQHLLGDAAEQGVLHPRLALGA